MSGSEEATDNRPRFEGHGGPSEHRTVGPHRAWCDCGEWCYPDKELACHCCMEAGLPGFFTREQLQEEIDRLRSLLKRLDNRFYPLIAGRAIRLEEAGETVACEAWSEHCRVWRQTMKEAQREEAQHPEG